MESQKSLHLKVGLFIFAALVSGLLMIFAIGSSKQFFDKQVTLYSSFSNVAGLQIGSQVRLGGLRIGVVDSIWIPKPVKGKIKCSKSDPMHNWQVALNKVIRDLPPEESESITAQGIKQAKNICIRMKVIATVLSNIRVGLIDPIRKGASIASVDASGILGNSVINLSIGTLGRPAKADDTLIGITPAGIKQFMAKAGKTLKSVEMIASNIDQIIRRYNDPKLTKDLKSIIGSVAALLVRAKQGPGFVHDLVYSPDVSRKFRKSLGSFQRTASSLARTAKQVNVVLAKSQRKGTLTHKLLLSRTGGRLINRVETSLKRTNKVLASVDRLLVAPQKKGTLLNELLYSKKNGRIMSNINKSSLRMKQMMQKVYEGKGTLGRIINDPTAFEDFKTILGQVKRSRVFRGLVRFLIKRDDGQKGGKVLRRN